MTKYDSDSGPYYYKLLKKGDVRFCQSRPKGSYVRVYITKVANEGQHQWWYLDVYKPVGFSHLSTKICDFENLCGYDRGPKFEELVRRLLG